jgi:mannosyltransferase
VDETVREARGTATGTGEVTTGEGAGERAARGGDARLRPRFRGLLAARVPWAVALVTLAVGLWRFTRPALWRDEAVSYTVARWTPAQILRLTGHTDAVHTVYYLLAHLVFRILGPGPAALRLPSVLAAAAIGGLVTATARHLASPRAARPVGLAAGLAWAAAPLTTRYAQEGRPYALTALCVTLAAYALAHRRWTGYGVALACAGLLNLMALLAVAAFAVTVVCWRLPRAQLARWAVASAGGCLGALPVALRASGQTSAVAWLRPPTWHTPPALAEHFAGGRIAVLPVTLLVLAALARAVRGPAGAPGRGRELVALALPLLVLPAGLLLAVSVKHPFYNVRYVFYALPALAWLVGAGAEAVGEWAARLTKRHALAFPAVLLALAVPAAAGAPAQLRERREDGHGSDPLALARIVGHRSRPGDLVVFEPKTLRSTEFSYPASFARTCDPALLSEFYPIDPDGRERRPTAAAAALHAAPTDIWVFSGPGQHRKHHSRDETLWRSVTAAHHVAGQWQVGLQVLRRYVPDHPAGGRAVPGREPGVCGPDARRSTP